MHERECVGLDIHDCKYLAADISAVDPKKSQMRKIRATVDSGAADCVISPDHLADYPGKDSPGSLAGQHYVAAGGEDIPNLGEQHIKARDKMDRAMNIKFQSAEVRKPLLSVAKICEAGRKVEFDSKGGKITHLKTGKQTVFNIVNGVYVLDLWVLPCGESQTTIPSFHRRGS